MRLDAPRDLLELRRSLGRLFDGAPWDADNIGLGFSADVYETAEAIEIIADLPGVDPKDVSVQVHGGQLSIRATRTVSPPKGASELRSERASGEFLRTFSVGMPLQIDAITATCANGVLTVRLPKAEEARPKQIAVKAAK